MEISAAGTNIIYILIGLTYIIQALGQEIPVLQVRLMDGGSASSAIVRDGRVEIFYEGEWGTICDDGWGSVESGVICRMLGFIGASRPHNGSFFKPAADDVSLLLDDVKCSGNEASIAECWHAAWGVSNCGHREDAGVTCLGVRVATTPAPTPRTTTTTAPPTICNDPSTDVRLVDGDQEWVGRVQVRLESTWWDVCDDAWGIQDAQVVCRMLCYNPANARAHLGPTFGNTSLPILLDDVECDGTEQSIFDCASSPPKTHNCDDTEGAGVSCMPDTDGLPLAPDPEIECHSNTETITAIFLRSDDPRLRPEYLTIKEASEDCGYTTRMDEFYVYITIPFIGCNTRRSINTTHIMYNNMIKLEVPPEGDVITRRQKFLVPVICLMGRNDDPDNVVAPEEQTVAPQYGIGHFKVQMLIYETNSFKNVIDAYPVRVTLGGFVYVALTLTTTDTQLKIVVPRCYATPEEDPASTPQLVLIEDKCALDGSITYYPINQTMFAFRFQSFKFLTNSDIIYLHCKAYVCGTEEKDERCDRTCSYGSSASRRKRRDISDNLDIFFANHTVLERNQGPLIVYDPHVTPRIPEGNMSATPSTMTRSTSKSTNTTSSSTTTHNHPAPAGGEHLTGSTTTSTNIRIHSVNTRTDSMPSNQVQGYLASSTDRVGTTMSALLVTGMTVLQLLRYI